MHFLKKDLVKYLNLRLNHFLFMYNKIFSNQT